MGNQVTIKLDNRIFFGLIALLAVLGIFAIGWWLGTQLNGGEESAQTPAGATSPAIAVDASGTPQLAVATTSAGLAENPTAAKGAKPVLLSDVPVGESEARVAFPEIEATDFTYDFGKIPAAEVTERDFIVKNVGTAELIIEEATASCGCTAAIVADPTVGPGEETTVRVSYDPRVNREAGRFVTKQIRIKSNDPLVPLAEFTIRADVAAQ